MIDQGCPEVGRPASRWKTGYCTNVHAGVDLAAAQSNLLRYAVPIREALGPESLLPVGLWLAEPAARTLQLDQQVTSFREWLESQRLLPFTFNGFPQGDFHQPVVKQRVYQPSWDTRERLDYTLLLIDHLHALLPVGEIGSISTLPLGWGKPEWSDERFRQAAEHLEEVAEYLRKLEETTGRRIVIAIEPEPGCVLDTSKDMVDFFSVYLSDSRNIERNRRYLTVCHDICHAAVMFESHKNFFDSLRSAGLLVGKIQVSAALEVRWSELSTEHRGQGLQFLSQFAEDRYLHQTGILSKTGFSLWDDLPQLLACYPMKDFGKLAALRSETTLEPRDLDVGSLEESIWRIHFHVPICESKIGELYSTQGEIKECFTLLNQADYLDLCPTGHLEVETYAWSVIPTHLRQNDLAQSITGEIRWLRDFLTEIHFGI
jgi:hypothetical protein